MELEDVERHAAGLGPKRLNLLTPATTSATPVISRGVYRSAAILGSLFAAFLLVIFLEWQNQAVHRLADVYRWVHGFPVLLVPDFRPSELLTEKGSVFLRPLPDLIREIVKNRGQAVVQILSMNAGDGKSSIAQSLANALPKSLCEDRVSIIDTETPPGSFVGNQIHSDADLLCFVIQSGRTTAPALRMLKSQLAQYEPHRIYFILNRFKDPLPSWLNPS